MLVHYSITEEREDAKISTTAPAADHPAVIGTRAASTVHISWMP